MNSANSPFTSLYFEERVQRQRWSLGACPWSNINANFRCKLMIRCFRYREKKIKLECNASKELKEKGQGDLKSMVKFIPSRGDTKRPPAAERAVKNRLLQSGHFHLSASLWPIMSDDSGLSLIFRVNLAPFIKRNKIRRNGWCPFITAPQARHVKWMKKNKGPQTNRWRGKGTAEC